MKKPIFGIILRTVFFYAFISGLWIIFSDKALQSLRLKEEIYFKISIYKGWLFVIITSLLLALKLKVELKKQKEAEEKLEALNKELEVKVKERTEDLEKALKRAEEADKLKSAFLAVMSHELRTPLNSIIGFTGLMLKELPGPLNEEQKKQLFMVKESSSHLLSLINDVLDISKIEADQIEIFEEEADLREILEKTSLLIEPLASKKNLKIEKKFSSLPNPVFTDKRRLEQILINLLNNSVKFSEKGKIEYEAGFDGKELIFKIKDNGIGIKEEDIIKLFKPFSQIENGSDRNHEGTGLGLAISYKLAKILGGNLKAESVYGKGSVFTLALPYKGKNEEKNIDNRRQ
ncbi:MAG: hypothetical protein GX447_03620 [Elusimicrobia bacterium]|nr:hypothetical protein [Elusimicrobiota bacterium]